MPGGAATGNLIWRIATNRMTVSYVSPRATMTAGRSRLWTRLQALAGFPL